MNEAEFWANMEETEDGCWEWQLSKQTNGYGQVWFNGEQRTAHRLSWILTHGDIPEGICVLHRCDNPPCCNPDHLFLGTQADNMKDMTQKGRSLAGETNPGSKLSESQVLQIKDRYKGGDVTQTELADIYHISQTAINDIVNGRRWGCLSE